MLKLNDNASRTMMKVFFAVMLMVTSSTMMAQVRVPLFGGDVEVKYAIFSDDGKYLAVAIAQDSLFILDGITLRPIRQFL